MEILVLAKDIIYDGVEVHLRHIYKELQPENILVLKKVYIT